MTWRAYRKWTDQRSLKCLLRLPGWTRVPGKRRQGAYKPCLVGVKGQNADVFLEVDEQEPPQGLSPSGTLETNPSHTDTESSMFSSFFELTPKDCDGSKDRAVHSVGCQQVLRPHSASFVTQRPCVPCSTHLPGERSVETRSASKRTRVYHRGLLRCFVEGECIADYRVWRRVLELAELKHKAC